MKKSSASFEVRSKSREGSIFRSFPRFFYRPWGIDIYRDCTSVSYRRTAVSKKTFSERNRARCESPNGFNHKLDSWSLSDWMTATLGELGEAANIVKKLNRVRDGIPGNVETEDELWAMLVDELADAAIYLDLLVQAAGFGFNLEEIRERKCQKTSRKLGYKEDESASA